MSGSVKRTAFARAIIQRPDPGTDEYRVLTLWGDVQWKGTYDQAIARGIDPDRLARARETGTSSRTGAFGWGDRQ